MKKLVTFGMMVVSFLGYAQSRPIWREDVDRAEDLLTRGWVVLDTVRGDLNKDEIPDFVFAIQKNDSKNIVEHDGFGTAFIDLNPRVFGIYFGTASGGFVRQFLSDTFVILRDSPTMDEPFGGFDISSKGVLSVNFKFWYSAGSWSMSGYSYKFRFQDNEFVLIGYDANEAHRGTGETTDYSINFLTKKIKIARGNFSKDKPDAVEWKRFHLTKPFTLKTLEKPFENQIEGIEL